MTHWMDLQGLGHLAFTAFLGYAGPAVHCCLSQAGTHRAGLLGSTPPHCPRGSLLFSSEKYLTDNRRQAECGGVVTAEARDRVFTSRQSRKQRGLARTDIHHFVVTYFCQLGHRPTGFRTSLKQSHQLGTRYSKTGAAGDSHQTNPNTLAGNLCKESY